MLTEIRQTFYKKNEEVSKLDFSRLSRQRTNESNSPRNITPQPHPPNSIRKLTLPETLNMTPSRLQQPSRTQRNHIGSLYIQNASPGL